MPGTPTNPHHAKRHDRPSKTLRGTRKAQRWPVSFQRSRAGAP